MYTKLPDQETLALLLDYNPDTGILTWKERPASMFTDGYMSAQGRANNWNSKLAGTEAIGYIHTTGYKYGKLEGKTVKAHRVAWKLYHGKDPVNDIDHINGDRADNRICNLRDATDQVNRMNTKRYKNNKSGVIGIHWHNQNNKWRARITVKGKIIELGCFEDIENAKKARAEAEIKYGFHPNHGRDQ